MKYLLPASIILLKVQTANAFLSQSLRHATVHRAGCIFSTSTEEEDTVDLDNAILKRFSEHYSVDDKMDNVLSFDLEKFKPLGCTAEESLFELENGSKSVFIGKLVEDGNAQKAGLKVGDAIVAVSGNFNEVVDVFGLPLEKIKGLIGGRNENEGLTIKVIRGSDVMAKHESALVGLCVLPENDMDVDNCIETMYKADYEIKQVSNGGDNGVEECDDDDVNCMLDAMFGVWGEELGLGNEKETAEEEEVEKKKPAPWSSRSSPSGTFVRDPKTGKMVNIDE